MSNMFAGAGSFVHTHIMFLNSSKFFAGIMMILLNIGSKFISVQFSRSTEEYLKMNNPPMIQIELLISLT